MAFDGQEICSGTETRLKRTKIHCTKMFYDNFITPNQYRKVNCNSETLTQKVLVDHYCNGANNYYVTNDMNGMKLACHPSLTVPVKRITTLRHNLQSSQSPVHGLVDKCFALKLLRTSYVLFKTIPNCIFLLKNFCTLFLCASDIYTYIFLLLIAATHSYPLYSPHLSVHVYVAFASQVWINSQSCVFFRYCPCCVGKLFRSSRIAAHFILLFHSFK